MIAQSDWSAFDPAAIPTKTDIGPLDRWLATLHTPGTMLDLGCGVGSVARLASLRGFEVTGIDINSGAIEAARSSVPSGRFLVADVSCRDGLAALGPGVFDAVVCQLLLSIVGSDMQRRQALTNARAVLAPSGQLFASFSGRSEDINETYAALYRDDAALTGEEGTYISRAPDGRPLYQTHHFQAEEIRALLRDSGFTDVVVEERVETSSRRHDQAARFFYASASAKTSALE